MEKGVTLPSGREGGCSSSGLTEAITSWLTAMASQVWNKTVSEKVFQMAAQGTR